MFFACQHAGTVNVTARSVHSPQPVFQIDYFTLCHLFIYQTPVLLPVLLEDKVILGEAKLLDIIGGITRHVLEVPVHIRDAHALPDGISGVAYRIDQSRKLASGIALLRLRFRDDSLTLCLHHGKETVYDIWIELPSGMLFQLCDSRLMAHGTAVRPVRNHGIICIHDGNHP